MDMTKFSFKQKVYIKDGFYKGYKGIVLKFIHDKTKVDTIIYDVKIESENLIVTIEEQHLRGLKLGII